MFVAVLRVAHRQHYLVKNWYKMFYFDTKVSEFPPPIKNSEFRLEFAVFIINLATTEISPKLLRI